MSIPVFGTTPIKGSCSFSQFETVYDDRFKLLALIGGGEKCCIFMVYDQVTQNVRALKKLRTSWLNDLTSRSIFENELLLWRSLNPHPHIVTASPYTYRNIQSLIMEYVPPDKKGRRTLRDHILDTEGNVDLLQNLQWAIHICLGMEHVNREGIRAHRDIKLSNIFVDSSGTAKIADFGLAINSTSHVSRLNYKIPSEANSVRGTAGYIAPKLYDGETADVSTDLYSFGIVLWQLITGKSTSSEFHDQFTSDSTLEIDSTFVRKFPLVTSELVRIVSHCIDPPPSFEYLGFYEVRRDLENLYCNLS